MQAVTNSQSQQNLASFPQYPTNSVSGTALSRRQSSLVDTSEASGLERVQQPPCPKVQPSAPNLAVTSPQIVFRTPVAPVMARVPQLTPGNPSGGLQTGATSVQQAVTRTQGIPLPSPDRWQGALSRTRLSQVGLWQEVSNK